MPSTNFRTLTRQSLAQLLFILLLASGLAQAENNFASGTVRLGGSASASTTFDDNNFQLGIGIGYFPVDGLELGLDARFWFGGDTNIYEVAPSITYVFTKLGNLKPYTGVLYRKTFIEGRDDQSAYGARAGVYLQQSPNLILRAGMVAVWQQDCDSGVYADCSEVYPEVAAGFYF